MKIGERLKSIRNDKGWSLEKCASRTQLSAGTLHGVEGGKEFNEKTALFLPEAYALTRDECEELMLPVTLVPPCPTIGNIKDDA